MSAARYFPHANGPFSLVIATVFVGVAAWRFRVHWKDSRFVGVVFWSAIAGGVFGELASYVIRGVPDGAPNTLVWLGLGALGMGGTVGVAVALAGLWLKGVMLIVFALRQSFTRHAA